MESLFLLNIDRVSHQVAMIEDIEVRLVHYKTEGDYMKKRKNCTDRIMWDNLFIIETGHDIVEREDLMERLNRLPHKNKIMFTLNQYLQYDWAICAKCIADISYSAR